MKFNINAWLRQPTTVAGLAALGGGATALANGATLAQAAVAIVPGLIGVLLPDHTGTVVAVAGELAPAAQAVTRAADTLDRVASALPTK